MSAPLHQKPDSPLTVLVLATHDEEPLAATLACVQEFADRLVVIDGATAAICGALPRAAPRTHRAGRLAPPGANVERWPGAWCSAGWILCLEAGETIAPGAMSAIANFARGAADAQAAYVLMIEIPGQAGQTSGEQAAQVRLIPADRSLLFCGGVRPTLLPAIAEAEMDLRHLAETIQRGAREYDQRVRTIRAQRDLKCAAATGCRR